MHFNNTVSNLRRRSCSYVVERIRDLNTSSTMQTSIEATSNRLTDIIQVALGSDTLTNELQRQLELQQTTRRASVANVMSSNSSSSANMAAEYAFDENLAEEEIRNTVINMIHNENEDTNNAPPPRTTEQQSALSQLYSLYLPIQGVFPFAVICFSKLVFDHRMGILMLIGLYGTFHHANAALIRNITDARTSSRQCSRSLMKKLCAMFRRDAFLFSNAWIIGFLTLNIFLVYYMFSHQQLHNSLMFQMPAVTDEFNHISFWTLTWIVGITDFIIKFGTIIFKTFMTMTPEFIVETKHKGRYYMLIERISQTYRSLTPIRPWLAYLYEVNTDTNMYFSIFTIIAYAIFKGYGVKPNDAELTCMDHCCPICQDKIIDPVKLSCTHIFCDSCISHWFDREKTCPMCRKPIVEQPLYRDGTTYNIPMMC